LSDNDQELPQKIDYELTDPDVRLMLQVRDDNAAAFEELLRRYQDRLIGILEHLTHGSGNAEDLAQDVFLRVFRSRKTYQPDAKFATWLFTIANNVARNSLRSTSRRKEVSASGSQSGEVASPNPLENMAKAGSNLMPARQLDKLEISEIMQLALQSLSERQRMALLLSKFEGMSYQDIGQAMEMSPKAVKSLLSRARQNLREILEPYFESGNLPFSGKRLKNSPQDDD
jgi:RNA polymerase sigma-70 factor (ECF subfamily)